MPDSTPPPHDVPFICRDSGAGMVAEAGHCPIHGGDNCIVRADLLAAENIKLRAQNRLLALLDAEREEQWRKDQAQELRYRQAIEQAVDEATVAGQRPAGCLKAALDG